MAAKSSVSDLNKACAAGDLTAVKLLIGQGASVNESSSKGWTPLQNSSCEGHLAIVKELLKNGADVNRSFSSLSGGNQKYEGGLFVFLSQGGKLNGRKNEGYSPLELASGNGQTDVVNYLLSKGAKIEARDNGGFSSLVRASENGHTEVVNLLLSKGADTEARQNEGVSSLYIASENGHTEVVNLLLSKGADIQARDNEVYSSIIIASQNGHTEVVNLLLSKGADIEARDNEGFTALIIASQNGHVPVAEMLLRHGADLEAKTNEGYTALHMASKNGHIQVAEVLLRHGANLEARYNRAYRLTPVGLASGLGQDQMVEFLVRQGAILDTGDRTPMDVAAVGGNQHKMEDIKNILSKPELNFKGGDDASKSWSAQEKLSLIRSCNTRIVTAGELKSGKTSLARSIISKTQYRANLSDRTVVVEQRRWEVGKKTIPIVDLGGHKSYRVTGMFFLANAPNNIVLLCHDIRSNRYILTYHWVKDIVCQAPEAIIIPVLTMTDRLPPEENQTRKERFVQEISRHLRLEIESLESKLAQATRKDTKQKIRKIIDCYSKLVTGIPHSLITVSTAPMKGDTIEYLKKQILLVSSYPENQLEIPAVYEAFYSKIGCIGTKLTSNLERNLSSSNLKETAKIGAISVEDDLDDKQTKTLKAGTSAISDEHHHQSTDDIGAYNTSPEYSTQQRGTEIVGSQSYDETQSFVRESGVEPVKPFADTQNPTLIASSMQEELFSGPQDVRPKETQKTTTLTNIRHKLGKLFIPKKKLSAKPYLTFDEVKTLFEETEKEMMSEPGPLQHDVRKCLSILHNLGTIMWFQGTKTLENYVFHNFETVTRILKAVFHHRADEFLDHSRLSEKEKHHFSNKKSSFAKDVNLLHKHGIMTREILQTLLRYNECKIEDDKFILDLLKRLDIAFKLEPAKKFQSSYQIFIPFYLQDKLIPTDVIKKIEDAKISNDGKVILKCCISGNISQTYFNKVLVQIYKDVDLLSALKDVWGQGVFMEVKSVLCILTYDGKEEVEIIANGHPKFLPKMWKMIQKITRGTKGLQEEWYPGLIEAYYVLCPCEHQYATLSTSNNHEPCRLDLEKVMESPETFPPWFCRNTREQIPAAYYTPVQEGASNCKQMIKEVEAFVEKLQQGKVQVIEEWRILALETMHPDPVILKLCAKKVLSLEDQNQLEGKDLYAKVKLLLEKVDSSRKHELVTALEATNYHSNVSLAQFITGNCKKDETFLSEKDSGSILKEFAEVFVENVNIDELRDQLISKLILDQSQWEELEVRQTRTKKAYYLLYHILLRGTMQTVRGFHSGISVCQPGLAKSLEKAVPNIIANIDNH